MRVMRYLFALAVLRVLSLAASPAYAQQNSLRGIWVGGHPAIEGYVMVRMQVGLDSTANDAQASINVWERNHRHRRSR